MVPVGASPVFPFTINRDFHSPSNRPDKKKTGTASKEQSRFFRVKRKPSAYLRCAKKPVCKTRILAPIRGPFFRSSSRFPDYASSHFPPPSHDACRNDVRSALLRGGDRLSDYSDPFVQESHLTSLLSLRPMDTACRRATWRPRCSIC